MATFVRFAGCNLRCSYCDTAYSLREEDAEEWLTEEELLRRIRAYPWKRVTLTGGEPLLQPLSFLCDTLGREGFECNIETNGAVPMLETRPEGLFYTMDWKCPDSGMEGRMCADNFPRLEAQDVVKFVVGSERDLCAMERVVRRWFMKLRAAALRVARIRTHRAPPAGGICAGSRAGGGDRAGTAPQGHLAAGYARRITEGTGPAASPEENRPGLRLPFSFIFYGSVTTNG